MSTRQTRPNVSAKMAAAQKLLDLCPPGTHVYTILRTRARSGKSQSLDMYVIRNNRPVRITSMAARLLEVKSTLNGAMIIESWGADAGFYAVHQLSYALHGMLPTATHRAGHSLNQEWL